ncbi:hypothetical protein [Paenibacillus sp. 37]|uniref:hypothetical protein n=1 Tax=Paenibacillus sp. 37 TaxID=2607911 RepID=UPI00122DDB10|nr:hypothetical protein [Paenibacillus sp. 37]
MRPSKKLKLASLILGSIDDDENFSLFQGYVMNESYFIFLDEGALWLRHVYKVDRVGNIYINGDAGGIILAEQTQGDARVLIESIVDQLSEMDALTFLTDVLLWTPERVDMNLRLDRFQ